LLALLALGGCASANTPMLPPQLHDEPNWFRGFGEPPLWTPKAAVGYRQRVRLALFPVLRQEVAVRIDTDASGRTSGSFTRMEWVERGWEVAERRRFSVSPARLAALDDAIERAGIWKIQPEFWQTPEGEICVDGVMMIMERVDARGYRFSEANAQCSAPGPMLNLAAQMIALANPSDAKIATWLRP
jgi:hypothetical protein